jgi:hypothetical protein
LAPGLHIAATEDAIPRQAVATIGTGVDLSYMMEHDVTEEIKDGQLVQVLAA